MSALGSRDNPFATDWNLMGPGAEPGGRAEPSSSSAAPRPGAGSGQAELIPEDPFLSPPVNGGLGGRPALPDFPAPAALHGQFLAQPSRAEPPRAPDRDFGGFDDFARHPAGTGRYGGRRTDADLFAARDDFGSRGDFRAGSDWGFENTRFAPEQTQPETMAERAFEAAALNPLVGAASPLLWLAARLNESSPPTDPHAFRNAVLDEVRRFGNTATARGIAPGLVRVARYALCATIDDIVLNTAWGGQSEWTTQGLVSTLYQETWGGERFFDLLGQLHGDPARTVDALELMAICLAIGFVGKYRVVEGGAGQLIRLRGELYRTIRNVRGPYERDLSPGWAAIAAPYKAPTRTVWLWSLAAALVAALVGLYLILGILLSNHVGAAVEAVEAVPPDGPVLVERPAIPEIPVIPEPEPLPVRTQVERISALLPDDIAGGQVEVVRDGAVVEVRLLATSFPSGGSDIAETQGPLLQRIASALDAEPGPITVRGYTDNVPLNPATGRTNLTLSAERAASAAEMLRRYLSEPERVASEGMGEVDPIASNATAEGRARNRRVEFQIPAEDAPL